MEDVAQSGTRDSAHRAARPINLMVMVKTPEQYSVREADLGADGEHLIRLWADNLLGLDGAAAKAKLEQGYRHNPVGGASVQLLEFSGEPQGAQGLNARHFWRGDERFLGAG